MTDKNVLDFDVIVVGAGFGGLCMSYRLGEIGCSYRTIEMGAGVGGTWYWNRYPGARVDVESLEYSFSFSKEVQDEWTWTEMMSPQPEIERYANFVADRLDLRRHISFDTRVTAMTWNDADATWTVETDRGDKWVCRFVVTAVGCLSAPLEPQIEGLHSFAGTTLFTNRFPKEGFDFSGQRVGIVGTGSSGVQSVPVVAQQAEHLYVFQRSAAFTVPAANRAWHPGEFDELRKDYDAIRAAQHASPLGTVRFGAVTAAGVGGQAAPNAVLPKILSTSPEDRLKRLDDEGWRAVGGWADVMHDMDANRAATGLYAEMIRRVVRDPKTAEALVPHYPMGCKRQIIDIDYFQSFNRANVTLVDLREGGIRRVTEHGLETGQGTFELDTILYATGFDAMTGALNRIDIRGRDRQLLRDRWVAEGPQTYLGLQIAGFPNLFTITGPGSPSVNTNMISAIEQHVDWIGICLAEMRQSGFGTIEATASAQDAWVAHVASAAETNPARTHESCSSWYLGANIPGKPRVYMPYSGGLDVYRDKCTQIMAKGYEGFILC